MEAFHFLRPWWLLGIVLFLVLIPWLWKLFTTRSGWHQVIAPHLGPALLGKNQSTRQRGWFAVLSGAWVIACVALAGPAWERLPTASIATERSAIIIIDMSLNTRASDISPDRLTRLRFKALDLLDALEGSQVGLIAYAGDAYTISPLTRDFDNMRGMIPALSPEIMPEPGNYPLRAFTEADRMVTDAGFERAEIYWLSAGMRLDDYQEISRFVRGTGHRISTLIAGDEERSPIRLATGDILRDSLGRLSMAELNAGLFERLSREFNGRHARLQADNQDIDYITAQGPWHEQAADDDSQTSEQWRDRGPYLAWLLLPLALLTVRRGVLLGVAMFSSCLVFYMPVPVAAATSSPTLSERALLNQQQRAQRHYQRGEYHQAAQQFSDPMMRGNALYRAEDYAAALDAFAQAGDTPERWFNTGNTLAQLGEFSAASEAFEEALAQRPDWPEALENKQLVDQLNEQQQQSNSQQEEQDNQNNEPQSESEGDQDSNTESGDDDSATTEQPSASSSDEQSSQSTSGDPSSQTEQEQSMENSEASTDEPAEEQSQQPDDSDAAESDAEQALNESQMQAALADDSLTDEEREELEQLMRRVQNDPATLLRNRMRLEAERRQQTQPPRGVRRP